MDTDASNYGIGAVLSQVQEGQECVIAYYSQVLGRSERQYCTTRKELLAAVKAVKHFHPYLYGRSFTLRTDHAALRWLLSFRHPEGQIARWLERLQQYDFRVEHRPGLTHGNADALSRRPCHQGACKHCDHAEALDKIQQEAEAPVSDHQELPPSKVAPVTLDTTGLTEFPWTVEKLQESQRQDPDIGPVAEWMAKGSRPVWSDVGPCSEETKIYWAQWDSLTLQDGVIYRI